MLRSMYSAISGLKAHQVKMDVIGNNIANVNTVGFKKSQVSFQEVFSQTTSGASAPQGGKGGTNPQQVGLGVGVGSVRVNHTPGNSQRTDDPLDFFIGGDGYFTVSGDENLNNKLYTRAGNFNLDAKGNLVTAGGLKVLGFKIDANGKVSDTLSEIKIDKSNSIAATTTKGMELKGNLDSRAKVGDIVTTDTKLFDSLGNPYDVKYQMKKTEDNVWSVSIVSMKDIDNNELLEKAGTPTTTETINIGIVTFGTDGKIDTFEKGAVVPAPDKLTPTISDGDGKEADGTKDKNKILKDGKSVFGSILNLKWKVTEVSDFGGAGDIKIDLSQLTQYGNDTTAKSFREDGNTSGNIDSFTVSKSGEIIAIFSNGEQRAISQVALAKFDNAGGLSKEGSNLFKDTRNSGEAQFGKAGSAGYGEMLGGVVEMSNVDLSNEFTEMITTQRGFQANSRVITTSDEILQELVNLKR